MQLDLDQLNRPLLVLRWRSLLWSTGALGCLGVAGNIVLWSGWGSRAPSVAVMAALMLASGALPQFLALLLFSHRQRKQLVSAGVDVCPSCRWPGILGPADQSCPSCGSPRACAACGQRLLLDQSACPECGRAVCGRSKLQPSFGRGLSPASAHAEGHGASE
jgi:hypothetical protein